MRSDSLTHYLANSVNCEILKRIYTLRQLAMLTLLQQIARRVTDWKTQIKQDHLMHLSEVKYMFRCAQRNQAISALLLQQNPLFDYQINND